MTSAGSRRSKTRLQQARNARILHKTKVYLRNDPDSESQLKKLEEKEKKLIIPKLSYQLWSTHVPMPPMDPTISVKPNLRKVEGRRDDYYKLDAIGWNKEDGYVQVLRSSAVDKSFESVYEILKAHLVPASKDGSKEVRQASHLSIKNSTLGSNMSLRRKIKVKADRHDHFLFLRSLIFFVDPRVR